jgi:DNA-binding beta-propeller fold protein YncE
MTGSVWKAPVMATACAVLIQCAADAAVTPAATAAYGITASIPGPDGMWDDAAIDSQARHLFLAQSDKISMLDLTAGGSWTQMGVAGAMWHGVLPIESAGIVLGANGQSHALTVFDSKTGALAKAIPTSTGPRAKLSGKLARYAALADPDALAIDPKSGLIAAVNGGSGEVVLIDLATAKIIATVQVGGKLEFAVADGNGMLYVNVETGHEIAAIDVAQRKVVRRIAMKGCVEPKGLAYDAPSGVLVSACDNGVAKFMQARDGSELASLQVGRGADGVIVDEQRHRAFVPSGDDGTLSIFDLQDPRHITRTQVLPTQKGTRLGALNPRSGQLYLPSAQLGPPIAPFPWPSMVPGTFHVLIVSPVTEQP